MIDVIVAGGGPVGLASAILARLAGLEVLVIEPRENDIDKACGEGLMPGALAQLQQMGVNPRGIDFHGIRYIQEEARVEAHFAKGIGRGVRRTELHQGMRERARDLGVKTQKAKVTEITQNTDFVTCNGISSRYLIAADGLHSNVRSLLGLDKIKSGPRRYGIRQHFQVQPWSDLVEVYWLPQSEVYVTPVAEDTVGVAVLGGNRLSLNEAITSIPELSARLHGAEKVSSLKGSGPLRQSSRSRTLGRVLLVGDAAGYVDAATGEGLRIGFEQSRAAVSAIETEDLARYERDWKSVTRSYRILTNSLIWSTSNGHLRKLIVPTAQKAPWVFRRIVNSISH